MTQQTPSVPSPSPDVDLCEQRVDFVVQEVNTVQYLIWAINSVGGTMQRSMIKCISPNSSASWRSHETKSSASAAGAVESETVQAGYIWNPTSSGCSRGDILLRADKMTDRQAVERALRHELIHAFDDARGFIDPQDCFHHACSEIRAAKLSGDCAGYEAHRNVSESYSSGVQCVRRHAVAALENNPICRSFSGRAVEKVFPQCYRDSEPFVAPVYGMGPYGNQTFNVESGEMEGGFLSRWRRMSKKTVPE